MQRRFTQQSFLTRLVFGIVVLTLLTTFSAGLPAYWLTRVELERQAWLHLAGAQQATQSLHQAQRERLVDVATLLGERPTLQRFLREDTLAEVDPYLRAFQRQSGLDLLLLCNVEGTPIAGDNTLARCLDPAPGELQWIRNRPASLISHQIVDEISGMQLGQVVLGNWLDEAYLRQMASSTGVEQSILQSDGTRLVSTIPGEPAASIDGESTGSSLLADQQRILTADGRHYFATTFSMASPNAPGPLYYEVALPVDKLMATESRALTILAVSTGLVALLGILLGVWYVRKLTRPLQQLTQVAERIGGGNLTASVPTLSGPIEVITLAAALHKSQNSMLRALDELARAHAWLDSLVQSIVEGVVTFDSDGRVTFLNQRAAAFTVFSTAEAIGRHINELFPVSDAGNVHFLDLISARRDTSGSTSRVSIVSGANVSGGKAPKVVSRPGQRSQRRISPGVASVNKTVLEITAARLASPNGDDKQTALVLRDITEEETLRHLRSYFLANITHEFRTPLSTLNASIELLMDERENLSAVEMRQLLKPVHLSLLGLQTLIDNLLESSSIEAGRFVIRKRPLDLNQVIANALQMVQPLLERRQQMISLTEPADLPPLDADTARLTQVLVNLISNASKYSPIGASIDLWVEWSRDGVRVSIADRGPGIPHKDRANLFRNFVRVGAHSKDQYGIGLGLYVVKTTVEAHGGQIGVDDRAGGGSIFWFQLPTNTGGSPV